MRDHFSLKSIRAGAVSRAVRTIVPNPPASIQCILVDFFRRRHCSGFVPASMNG